METIIAQLHELRNTLDTVMDSTPRSDPAWAHLQLLRTNCQKALVELVYLKQRG